MMKDIYLKFDNEHTAISVLSDFGFQSNECGVLYMPGVCIDVIGVIYTINSKDPDNLECTAESGWHVNLRIIDDVNSEKLSKYKINPVTPIRVWAEVDNANA